MKRFVEIDHEPPRAQVGELRHRQLVAAADGRDRGGDAGVVRRDDLRAVAPVDLVAVVLRRVVARGDHHAGARVRRGDRPRGGRRRPRSVREVDAKPGATEHARGVLGELERVVARVVTDHDAASRRVADLCEQVGREPRRDLADEHAVHPVRAGAEDAAQPGGAELELAPERLGELRVAVAAVEQRAQLGLRLRIRIFGEPGSGGGAVRHRRDCMPLFTGPRSPWCRASSSSDR